MVVVACEVEVLLEVVETGVARGHHGPLFSFLHVLTLGLSNKDHSSMSMRSTKRHDKQALEHVGAGKVKSVAMGRNLEDIPALHRLPSLRIVMPLGGISLCCAVESVKEAGLEIT